MLGQHMQELCSQAAHWPITQFQEQILSLTNKFNFKNGKQSLSNTETRGIRKPVSNQHPSQSYVCTKLTVTGM